MSILAVGSVAFDTVVTPSGRRQDVLGGSATYFAVAGSYFSPISVVGVVGEDFRPEHARIFVERKVDTSALETRSGMSFKWSAVYSTEDLNTRSTIDTQLNVFADFCPKLQHTHRRKPYIFLANTDPDLQMDILGQVESDRILVGLDTMNFWIERKCSRLKQVVENIDVLFIDEAEARQFANEVNLVKAGRRIRGFGPKIVVVKRGEHGVLLFQGESVFAAPAFPLDHVVDPTGAGDAFAGGFLGYIAGTGDLSFDGVRRATLLGSVMGSFAVESFSVDRLASLTDDVIDSRFRDFERLLRFTGLKEGEKLPSCSG